MDEAVQSHKEKSYNALVERIMEILTGQNLQCVVFFGAKVV